MARSPLSELRVAKQCNASWAQMSGTDQVRHCSLCKKNVFNLSNMTQAESAELIRQTEGRVCVRYYQRKDGTVLTRDCSLGERVSLKARLALVAVAAVVGITMAAGCSQGKLAYDSSLPPATDNHADSVTSPTKESKATAGAKKAVQDEKVGPEKH